MKTIYLVRHGQSTVNVGGLVLSGDKVSLTDKGREQASFIGKRLSRLPVDLIIASTYLRATQTGHIIVEHINKPIEYSDLFIEWKQGTHRIGKNVHDPELGKGTRELIKRMHESREKIADEENFEDLNKRAGEALTFLLERQEQNIAVVSHGWFMSILAGKAIMGDDFTGRDCQHFMRALLMKNTGLTILTHGQTDEAHLRDNPWNLITWNDHAHLG